MNITIKPIEEKYKNEVINMMREFYSSPALITNGSEEIFNSNVNNCIGNSPYVEGYVFCDENKILGYGMIAKSFSTEFGKNCIWIEDLYIKKEFRGLGIGSLFFTFIEDKYKRYLFRLEVEKNNTNAIRKYKKQGFEELPYMEMKK